MASSFRTILRNDVFFMKNTCPNFGSPTLLVCCLLATFALLGCKKSTTQPASPQPQNTISILFAYGSEKETWINQVTESFNSAGRKLPDGRIIQVKPLPMGSGECVEQVLAETGKPHLISPASSVFLKLAEADSLARKGTPLLKGDIETLVLSPVVIAMWQPMAKALGWPGKALGWGNIESLATSKEGWAGLGKPQWGPFRYGHTHPEYSNSGLISILAEIHAAAGKTQPLTLQDLAQPNVAKRLEAMEQAVAHYGSSTGFFGKRMYAAGPAAFSAAVLYENMVVTSRNEPNLPLPLVAIYPKEGTFWSDHPAGVVNRPWVGAAEEAAGRLYLQYLMDTPAQQTALALGFRPGNVAVPVAAPIDAAHGADATQPQTTLPTPEATVIRGALDLWKRHKKHSHVFLALDCSGSMSQENRMGFARQGGLDLLRQLAPEDQVSALPFNHTSNDWAFQGLSLANSRAPAESAIDALFASGGTALYDALAEAHEAAIKTGSSGKIAAVVVLSDGADESSARWTLNKLLQKITVTAERPGPRIFTIAYGANAKKDVLTRIAEATQGKSYTGGTADIRQIFREISTFF
jgi:Ca-activated chloride channel homolog